MSKSASSKPNTEKPAKAASTRAAEPALEPKINIDSEVTRRIRQHARAHSKTEVCGVLIGEATDTTISIAASIEALNAAQAGTHVTFTQDAWEEIYRVKDDLYPEERIVGWYHSHPGFGVFLSEHDLFIQENFFSSPGQVAWVYDPHTDEEGCFGWVAGEVHRLSSLAILDKNGDGVERTPKRMESSLAEPEEEDGAIANRDAKQTHTPAWVRWTVSFLTHASVLAVGFALAYFLFPRFLGLVRNPMSGEIKLIPLTHNQVFDLMDQQQQQQPQPAIEMKHLDLPPAASAPPAAPPPTTSPSATPGSHP